MRTAGIASSSAQKVTTLLFDDFSGTSVDLSKWEVYNRIGDMVNRDFNCCVPSNVRVSGGSLLIDAKHENYTCQDWLPASDVEGGDLTYGPTVQAFTSGQVSTQIDFLYGTVTVRSKCAGIGGVWPCIWMLGHLWHPTQPYTANTPVGATQFSGGERITPPTGWPGKSGLGWWEIDIAEYMNNARTTVNCCIHYNTFGGSFVALNHDASTRFMTWKLVWTAATCTFYVDEEDGAGFRQVNQYTGGPTSVPDTPGYLTINMAVADTGGSQILTNFPLTMEVDYVRITQP